MTELELMLERYRDMKAELSPAIDRLADMERAIKRHVEQTGETAAIEGASVSIRGGYERVTWDSKALAGYAAAHPEIEQFKSTAAVKPSAVISVR